MLEEMLNKALGVLIPLCELMGIFVVAVTALGAFVRYIKGLFTGGGGDIPFRLAVGLALSLEFKMAAEILKTVQVRSLDELTVLGVVILLRALLSALIHFEMKQVQVPHREDPETGGT